MKLSTTLLSLAAAYGVACADDCTTKTTTTITQTFFNSNNGTVNIATGSGMMSVYNGSTSVITVTGAMTNPFATDSTTTFTKAVSYSYVTVPRATCTVGKACIFTGHGPVVHPTPVNASSVGASLTTLPQTLSADNGTIFTTMTMTTSTNGSALVSSPASVVSSKVSTSVTITSFLTQITTKVVTAPAIVETVTAASTPALTTVTVTTTGTVTSTAIPIFTITFSPVPLSPVTTAQESRRTSIVTPVDATNMTASLSKAMLSIEQSTSLNKTTVTVTVAGSSCMAVNTSTSVPVSSSVSSMLSLTTVEPTGAQSMAVFSSSGRRASIPRLFMWVSTLSKLVSASFGSSVMPNGTSSHGNSTTVFPSLSSANHSLAIVTVNIATVTAVNASSPIHAAGPAPSISVTTVTAILVLNSTVTTTSVAVSTSTKTILYNVYETDKYTSTVTELVTATGVSSGSNKFVSPWYHSEGDFSNAALVVVFYVFLAVFVIFYQDLF